MFKKAEEIQKQFMKVEELQVGTYKLETKGRLAEGGFGKIDLVIDVITKTEYVLKRCAVQRQDALDAVQKEVHILQLFDSPYIVKLMGTEFLSNKSVKEAVILMEYCPGGHLLDRLQKREGVYIPEKQLFRFFGQLLNAVCCLHTSNPYVVHRDLKLENILVAVDGTLRLCDFGSCVFGSVSIRTPAERSDAESVINKETTPIYRAPEMIDLYMREELTEKTDIWALGCIFYGMAYLKLPFQEGATLAILSDKISYPPIADVSESSIVFMKRMLDFDAEARPTVQELLSACTCIVNDEPLPAYEISEIAKQRRVIREAAAVHKQPVVRAVKKPLGPVIPARSAVPAGTSSAAAKRLAAMKGSSSTTPSQTPDLHAFEFTTNFESTLPEPSVQLFSPRSSIIESSIIPSQSNAYTTSLTYDNAISIEATKTPFSSLEESWNSPAIDANSDLNEIFDSESASTLPTSKSIPILMKPKAPSTPRRESSAENLIDIPMKPCVTSAVMSLFDNPESDPFSPQKPLKPPKPTTLRANMI
jgi:serine/threonine protein kinase